MIRSAGTGVPPTHLAPSYTTTPIQQGKLHLFVNHTLQPAQSSLSEKTITVVSESRRLIQLEGEPNHLPTRYHWPSLRITKTRNENIINELNKNETEIKKNNNLANCYFIESNLKIRLAESFHRLKVKYEVSGNQHAVTTNNAGEAQCLNEAKKYLNEGGNLNPLHPLFYYTESMLMDYEGMDCTNFDRVGKYLSLLRTANALDPDNQEISEVLRTTCTFLKARWTELRDQESIQWLEKQLAQDPLERLFQNKPELFKLAVNPAHKIFFDQHPELKNIEIFRRHYPEVIQDIIVSEEATVEYITRIFEEEPANSFGSRLSLIAEAPQLEREVARELVKQLLKHWNDGKRHLEIFLGNEADRCFMLKAITAGPSTPSSLRLNGGSFVCETLQMEVDGQKRSVYRFFITQNPPQTSRS